MPLIGFSWIAGEMLQLKPRNEVCTLECLSHSASQLNGKNENELKLIFFSKVRATNTEANPITIFRMAAPAGAPPANPIAESF